MALRTICHSGLIVTVEMQTNSEKRCRLFQGIRGGGFEIIRKGDDFSTVFGSGNSAGAKLSLNHTTSFQLTDHNDLICLLEDFMLVNGKGPIPVKSII